MYGTYVACGEAGDLVITKEIAREEAKVRIDKGVDREARCLDCGRRGDSGDLRLA
jgi:hypothetical protein